MSELVDRYGQQFANYELGWINGHDVEAVLYPLGFTAENFNMADTQAVSCDVCGVLLTARVSFMRRHRLQCGWVGKR